MDGGQIIYMGWGKRTGGVGVEKKWVGENGLPDAFKAFCSGLIESTWSRNKAVA